MALSRIGGSSAAGTSIAIPAHQAGDLIVIWAYRDGSTTPPTKPTAGGTVPSFTTIDGPTGANLNSAICAWAVAAGTTDTSGTWTNATGMSVEVWRGVSASPIGGHAQSGGSVASGGNIAIPAITLTDPSGNSAILAFAGWQTVTAWNAAPAGYTQQSQVATECEALSKNTTTADGTFNVSGTASGTGGTRTQQIEIIAGLGNRVSQETVEALYSTTAAQARVSQEAVEVLQAAPPTVSNRVSQIAVEVLHQAVHTFAATISGVGSLAATVRRTGQFVATISGVGSLAATLTRYKPFAATISGAGQLTAAVIARLHTFAATIAGAGSLAATLRRVLPFTASISGTSSLSATVTHPAGGGGTHSFTASISGRGTLHVQPRLTATSGVYVFSGDEPAVWPLLGTNSLVTYTADDATVIGFLQADSGTFTYKGDQPVLPGTVTPASGVFRFVAAAPALWASIRPVSGKVTWRGDTPAVYPQAAQSGRYVFRGDAPTLEPIVGVSGRFRYGADGPRVYPLLSPSGVVLWKAGTPTLAAASVVIHTSGIIRYRSDVPVVTPLTEPVTPPPVSGTGLKIQVTV